LFYTLAVKRRDIRSIPEADLQRADTVLQLLHWRESKSASGYAQIL